MSAAARGARSKTLATWIALVAGGVGLHRFYLYGPRDLWGWAYPLPFALGLYGVRRMQLLGQDDGLSWLLVPLLGAALAASMLTAIVYGLTPDERWDMRHNPHAPPSKPGGWPAVIGVVLALFVGSGVLMATLAFSAQRYFEWQVEEGRGTGRSSLGPTVPGSAAAPLGRGALLKRTAAG